jgi:hypothetical protein
LPRPGTDEQLKLLAGRIVSQQLDRAKPLWELWIAEGLSGGRFAVVAKIHHCMIDGLSGVDLTTILLNVVPTSDIEEAPEWRPRRAPTQTELAVASAARATRRTIERLTSVGDLVAGGRQTLEHFGGRHFFPAYREFDVDGLEFRVMNPVSTRRADQRGALGNQVAMWLIELPLDEPDPVARFERIKNETDELKKSNHALGASTLVDLSRGTPITLISLASRFVGPHLRPFNMTVTNVPGPQFPMFMLEAKMLANYPMVPLWAQHGASIALFSYDGRLLWGIQADYDTLPDSADFIDSIHTSVRQLLNAATARA